MALPLLKIRSGKLKILSSNFPLRKWEGLRKGNPVKKKIKKLNQKINIKKDNILCLGLKNSILPLSTLENNKMRKSIPDFLIKGILECMVSMASLLLLTSMTMMLGKITFNLITSEGIIIEEGSMDGFLD